jgi:hypothetical protein
MPGRQNIKNENALMAMKKLRRLIGFSMFYKSRAMHPALLGKENRKKRANTERPPHMAT